MSYRLFAAVKIPDTIADMLKAMQSGLDGAQWRHRENFHITLRYFGELSDAQARDLDAEIAAINLPKLELRLSGVGHFGNLDPTAVWAGVQHNDTLSRLAIKCDLAAKRLKLGKDRHAFRPHVTLAYLNGATPQDVAAYAARHAMFESPTFSITQFGLYSSRPGKHQNAYEEEATYPLF